MRVLICGGRNFGNSKEDQDLFQNFMNNFCIEYGTKGNPDEEDNWIPKGMTIISGAAKGADTMAINWAVTNWCQFEEYPAEWEKYGKSAGYIRNKQMLDEGKPDRVIAFSGGKGTANMISIAKSADIPVIEVF